MKVQLVELDAWNGTAVVTLRYATHAYVTARSDTPPDTSYAARVASPVTLQRSSTSPDSTRGTSVLSVGVIDLVNSDGALDILATYAFAGREIRVYQVEQGAALASATLLFKGLLEQPRFDWDVTGSSRFQIIIRDKAFELEQPIQSATYGGTNALPAGVDGVDDLKGKYKPLLFGYAARIPVPCVNTARLIYQVSNSSISDVLNVYDRGLALGRGADYTSEADMQATAPAATQYRVWPAGGLFRLGSTPAGQVLCDAVEGATAAARYPGAVAQRVLLASGVALGDIDTTAFAAVDAACPWECGYWVTHQQAVKPKEIMDAIMLSTGGWWAANASNKIVASVLSSPAGTPAAKLHAGNIIGLARRQAKDDDRGIPPWRFIVGYARYWEPSSSDFAGAVSEAIRADLREEYRIVDASDAAVQTAYPAATEVRVDTLLRYKADAQTLATSRHAILKVRRDVLRADVRSAEAAAADLGSVVRVTLPRFGLSGGRLFTVVGVELDPRIDSVSLTLWG